MNTRVMRSPFISIFTGLLLGSLLASAARAETVLAAWENGSLTTSQPGIERLDVSLTGMNAMDAAGSTDGTYGSFGSGASASAASFKLTGSQTGTLTVANNTASSASLDAIRFDFVRRFSGSPKDIAVTYDSGDLGTNSVLLFQANNIDTTGYDSGDYPDYDVILSNHLADIELAVGDSATFSIVVDGATGGGKSLLDNLAITGEAVSLPTPPPSIAWYSGALNPDLTTTGVIVVASVSSPGSAVHGSTDGSYGTYSAFATNTGGAFELFDGDFMEIVVTNKTDGKMLLKDVRLDFNRRFSGSPTDVAVRYVSGDLDDDSALLGSLTNQSVLASDLADFGDLDCELRRTLVDTCLDAGESAVFRITVSGASGGGAAHLDNIGIFVDLIDYIAPPPAQRSTVAAARRPNVVIFYADDVGLGDVSAYGYGGMMSTPNIDALSGQGMRFMNAHTVYGTCAPSRYGILSGNLAFRGNNFNGTWAAHQTSQFLAGQKSLGNLFQEAGYRTSFYGKLHMGGQYYLPDGSVFTNEASKTDLTGMDWLRGFYSGPTAHGFDYSFFSHDGIQGEPYMYHENDIPVDGLAYDAVSNRWTWSAATELPYVFLQTSNPGQPGYISKDPDNDGVEGSMHLDQGENLITGYSYWDSTHTGEMYTQAARNFIDDHMVNNPEQPFFMHFCSQCVHSPHTPDTFFGDAVKDTELTAHLDMLSEMDLQVKALVDKLEEYGLENDTIIIYTSDNGGITKSTSVGHQPSGPFRGSKGDIWEGGHRVPFIIRWGDGTAAHSVVPPGTVCEQVISQTDLFSTFATLLDRPQDATQGLDGMNILPYFMGQFTPVIRDHLIAARTDYAFHLGGWKIIADCQAVAPYAPLAVLEMYHLESDPYETMDRAGDPAYDGMKNHLFAELTSRVTASRSTEALDGDADGLFDAWEREMAGDILTYDATLLSSTADGDGDGMTDADEYALRSNPAVADATTIESNIENGTFKMAWPSASGRFYQMEHRENLTTGSWGRLPETYIGNGENLRIEASTASTNGFFRMIIE